jgi:hypothetical protein
MNRSLLVLCVLAAPLAAIAQDFPKLKSGLWEMSNTTSRRNDAAPMKSTLCLDASVQQDMIKMSSGFMQGMCSKHDVKYSGNKVTGEAICKIGNSTMKSQSVMTMSGDSAYRTVAHATFDPPMAGIAESDTVVEGRHVGACKPGQQPGDMTMPNGQTMNIRMMMGGGK